MKRETRNLRLRLWRLRESPGLAPGIVRLRSLNSPVPAFLCLLLLPLASYARTHFAPHGYTPEELDRTMVHVPGAAFTYGMTAEQKLGIDRNTGKQDYITACTVAVALRLLTMANIATEDPRKAATVHE